MLVVAATSHVLPKAATLSTTGLLVVGLIVGIAVVGGEVGSAVVGDGVGADVMGIVVGFEVCGGNVGFTVVGDCVGAGDVGLDVGSAVVGDGVGAAAMGIVIGLEVCGGNVGFTVVGDCVGAGDVGLDVGLVVKGDDVGLAGVDGTVGDGVSSVGERVSTVGIWARVDDGSSEELALGIAAVGGSPFWDASSFWAPLLVQTPLPQTIPTEVTPAKRSKIPKQNSLDPVVDGMHLAQREASSGLTISAFGIAFVSTTIFPLATLLLPLMPWLSSSTKIASTRFAAFPRLAVFPVSSSSCGGSSSSSLSSSLS